MMKLGIRHPKTKEKTALIKTKGYGLALILGLSSHKDQNSITFERHRARSTESAVAVAPPNYYGHGICSCRGAPQLPDLVGADLQSRGSERPGSVRRAVGVTVSIIESDFSGYWKIWGT